MSAAPSTGTAPPAKTADDDATFSQLRGQLETLGSMAEKEVAAIMACWKKAETGVSTPNETKPKRIVRACATALLGSSVYNKDLYRPPFSKDSKHMGLFAVCLVAAYGWADVEEIVNHLPRTHDWASVSTPISMSIEDDTWSPCEEEVRAWLLMLAHHKYADVHYE